LTAQSQSLANQVFSCVVEMRKLGFEKDKHLVVKIVEAIKKLRVTMFGLKAQHKELSNIDLAGNAYTHKKELLNVRLDLEHNRNTALMELQRQRAT